MGIRDWFYHRHYWGIPHKREGDDRMIQICYECGKEREFRLDLRPRNGPDQGSSEDENGGERDTYRDGGVLSARRHAF